MDGVLEPWVTLRSVAQLDAATSAELYRTCQRLDAELAPAAAERAWLWTGLAALLAVATVISGFFLACR